MFKIYQLVMLLVISMTATVLTAGHAPSASADVKDSDKAAFEAIIRDYITANPELLRDALMDLAKREDQARQAMAMQILFDDAGDPVMGNPDGGLVIYEFSDYNCGYCKRVFEPIQQVLRDDSDIRFVIKEFPILSQSSLVAAQAGIAAEKQGKFIDFHINMMTYRGKITTQSIIDAATEAAIDIDQLKTDMQSPYVENIIARTRQAAEALQLTGTPALVIGDTIVRGAVDIDEFRRLIAVERAKQG
ncbi:DsbA family protein [Candidatus Puniceispirillum sp.]|jgi:protein-disulfide isomerase|uniref:DsbA family protein n=1 Tax=Candidatus Puniceispirillum sp. TaxID=2026719 RepID=UPI001EC043E1|nr:DsbA family protein [Candidatus Puniceispirillum sp.]MBT6565335.1 DsbA family protein [Candidatus Puniceispirillum sp.]